MKPKQFIKPKGQKEKTALGGGAHSLKNQKRNNTIFAAKECIILFYLKFGLAKRNFKFK